jgi:hypothetical protein
MTMSVHERTPLNIALSVMNTYTTRVIITTPAALFLFCKQIGKCESFNTIHSNTVLE